MEVKYAYKISLKCIVCFSNQFSIIYIQKQTETHVNWKEKGWVLYLLVCNGINVLWDLLMRLLLFHCPVGCMGIEA
jgi:hypothetical protein